MRIIANTRAIVRQVTPAELQRSPFAPIRVRRDALPRWFVGLLACLGVVALACVSTFWLINDIGNGVVR